MLRYPFILTDHLEGNIIKFISLAGVLLWCVGGIAIVAFILIRLPRYRSSIPFRRATIAVTVRFKTQYPWWYLVAILKNFFVAMAVGLFEGGSAQAVYSIFVLVVYLLALTSFKPYFAWPIYYADQVVTTGQVGLLLLLLLYAGTGAGVEGIIVVVVISYLVSFLLLAYCAFVVVRFKMKKVEVVVDDLLKDLGGKTVSKFPRTSPSSELALGPAALMELCSRNQNDADGSNVPEGGGGAAAAQHAVEEPKVETEIHC